METKTVTETCSECEKEIELRWDVNSDGFKAFCPHCGARLMLCDACTHRGNGCFHDDCDYCGETDSCRFNKPKEEQTALKDMIWKVRITWKLERDVYIRAHGYDDAEKIARELCNSGEISLDISDLKERNFREVLC